VEAGRDERRLQALLAKQDLAELNAAYSRAVDRLDEQALVDLFHPDAFVDSGVLHGDPRYFAREFVKWVRTHARVVSHSVCQQWFDVDGDVARGETYVLAVARLKEKGGTERDVLTAGRYLDRYARRDGRWRFLERRFVVDHSVAHGSSAPAATGADTPAEGRGCFGSADPVYRLWRDDRRR
jgi:hypothetical protein